MIYYFAYGSNLHPQRIKERVSSAQLKGVSSVSNYRFAFHKVGIDGSSKGGLIETGCNKDTVHGAIYEIRKEHKSILDEFESLNKGYVDHNISVEFEGENLSCFTYVAQKEYINESLKPYHWYKNLVSIGAVYLDFPTWYVDMIESVESIEDKDSDRRLEHESLISRMVGHR